MPEQDPSRADSQPPEEAPAQRPWWDMILGAPQDTPDRDPDDWLFEDSSGYRIPFDREADQRKRRPDGDPEQG